MAAFDRLQTLPPMLHSRTAGAPSREYMRRLSAVLFMLSIMHSPTLAQTVPEGVHTDVIGSSNICGISGGNALAIRQKLRADPSILQRPSGSERFETYFSSTESKEWTVTTQKDAAYPAVTCVYLYNSAGGTDMSREMRCDASRAACEALFQEFEANDEKIRKQIKSR